MRNRAIPKTIATIRADLTTSLRHFEMADSEEERFALIRRIQRVRRSLERLSQLLTEERRAQIMADARAALRQAATVAEQTEIMRRAVTQVMATMSPEEKLALFVPIRRTADVRQVGK